MTHLEQSLQRDIDRISAAIRHMAGLAEDALRRTMTALHEKNPQIAYSVILRDQHIDELEKEIDRLCLEFMVRQQPVAKPLRFVYVANKINSELQEVLYLCTGEYLKHSGSDVFRVLFVDEDNASMSQMAEAIGNSLGQPRFMFASAGLGRGPMAPMAVAFLMEKGLDISGNRGRTIDQVPHLDHYQVIVGLTKEARRVFPPPPTKAVCIEWNVANPSKDAASPEQVRTMYEQTYRFLVKHVRDLVEAVVQDKDH